MRPFLTYNAREHVITYFYLPQGAELVHDVAAGVVVSGRSLAVRHLRREHSGHYTCAATNQEGHNTSNAVQLTVKRE